MKFVDEYVVFDIETTGVSNAYNDITEISGVRVSHGKIVEEFSELVKPRKPISRKIAELTGITNAMVKDKPSIEIVGKRFQTFVKDSVVVAHNANFDVNFMYDNFIKYDIGVFNNDFIDTLRLSRYLIKDSDNHKLSTLIDYFGFESIGSHRGMPDALNTHKLLLELKDLHEANPNAFNVKRRTYQSLNLDDIKVENSMQNIDTHNPFYNQNICFTGIFNNFTKQEIAQTIANHGGVLQKSVNFQTDILILGDEKKQIQMYGSKSIKHRKVLDFQNQGKPIKIFDEEDLIKFIKQKK